MLLTECLTCSTILNLWCIVNNTFKRYVKNKLIIQHFTKHWISLDRTPSSTLQMFEKYDPTLRVWSLLIGMKPVKNLNPQFQIMTPTLAYSIWTDLNHSTNISDITGANTIGYKELMAQATSGSGRKNMVFFRHGLNYAQAGENTTTSHQRGWKRNLQQKCQSCT